LRGCRRSWRSPSDVPHGRSVHRTPGSRDSGTSAVLRGRCVSRGLPAGGRQFVDQPMRVGRDPRQHTAEVLKEDHTPTHTAIGWTSTTTALSPPSTGIRNTPSGGIAQGRVPRLLNSTPTPPAGPVYPLSGVPPRIGRGSPVASASEARPPVLDSRSGGPLADVITSDARITLHGTAPCAPSIVRHATQTTASKSPTPSPAIQTPASTLPNPQTPTPPGANFRPLHWTLSTHRENAVPADPRQKRPIGGPFFACTSVWCPRPQTASPHDLRRFSAPYCDMTQGCAIDTPQ
jgi:hypothetical protein